MLTQFAKGPEFEPGRALCPAPPPPLLLTFGSSVGSVLGLRAAKGQSGFVSTCTGPSRFGDEFISARGNCHGSIVWLFLSDIYCMTSFSVGHRNKYHLLGLGASIHKKNHTGVGAKNHPGVVSLTVFCLKTLVCFKLKF